MIFENISPLIAFMFANHSEEVLSGFNYPIVHPIL